MITTIECQGFRVTDAIDARARALLDDALRHCIDDIRRLDLQVCELGGRNGPPEYRIVANISLHNLPSVCVEGNGCDLDLTMRYVAGRAEPAVERAVLGGDQYATKAPCGKEVSADPIHPRKAAKV